jgi:HNH endonuclease
MEPQPCALCGAPFTQSPRGRPRRFCSPKCRGRAREARRGPRHSIHVPRSCEACGKAYLPPRKNSRFCSVRCRQRGQPLLNRTCAQCGAAFTAYRSPERFCSKRCRYRYRDAHRGTLQPCARCGEMFLNNSMGKTRDVRRYCSRACVRLDRAPDTPTACSVPWEECSECGRWFVAHWHAKTCSDECQQQRYQRQIRESNAKRYKPPVRCVECGTVSVRGSGRRRYCSAKCAKRASKRTERHRRRGGVGQRERFTLLEIAVRDSWRCHLCHRKVSRKTWSIDHLIPVSQGGDHTRMNVALAHRDCNARRGATGPAQLLLLG